MPGSWNGIDALGSTLSLPMAAPDEYSVAQVAAGNGRHCCVRGLCGWLVELMLKNIRIFCVKARQVIARYVGCCNLKRRHSTLGNIASAEFERRWYAAAQSKSRSMQPLCVEYPRVTHRRPPAGSSQAASWPSVDNAPCSLVVPTERGPVQSLRLCTSIC